MGVTTYIVDASTLVDRIHGLKQWVYDGFIHIHVPLCTLEQVAKQCNVAAPPQDKKPPQDGKKGALIKRSSGRAARKEQPLFDINPRTAQEYLARAQSEKGEMGVRLQLPGEEFTQWKEEEEVAKVESPVTAPTSFADALLRKLNIKDDGGQASKAPSKPRLVSRSDKPRSPWKYHKVPNIPSKDVPLTLKPLISCVLWRLHEFENNPLMPETYVLLTDNRETVAVAESLNIPVADTGSIRASMAELKSQNERRASRGQLEADFPDTPVKFVRPVVEHANGGVPPTTGEEIASKETTSERTTGERAAKIENVQIKSDELEEAQTSKIPTPKEQTKQPIVVADEVMKQPSAKSPIVEDNALNGETTSPAIKHEYMALEAPELQEPKTNGRTVKATSPVNGIAPIEAEKPSKPATPAPSDSTKSKADTKVESDFDSDEEVIVFNPRAKRASGIKKSTEAAKSRPTTANGPAKPFQGSPKRSSQVVRPVTSDGATTQNTLSPRPKSQVESTLKPQSPVFTPGQLYVTAQEREASSPAVEKQGPVRENSPDSPARQAQGRPNTPRHPRQNRPSSHDQSQIQRQSEMIIQRQREAIQRQAKAAAKPAPRQIQMEPTENPTVIDPDAFDRSYVVQPPSNNNSSSSNVKRRSGGRRRGSPRNSPPAESPRRRAPAAEPDVDFVLKSGAPRGSTRGKGKLWVP